MTFAASLLVLPACMGDDLVMSDGVEAEKSGAGTLSNPTAQPESESAKRPPQGKSYVSCGGLINYDTRAEFNGEGDIAHNNDFEGFPASQFSYVGSNYHSAGVTYTSGENLVVGRTTFYNLVSNVMAHNYWTPVTGNIDSGYDMFALDLGVVGRVDPIDVTIYTNMGTYVCSNLAIPNASSAQKFLGFTPPNAGEYFTGFRFDSNGSGSAPALDNVTLGVRNACDEPPVAQVNDPVQYMAFPRSWVLEDVYLSDCADIVSDDCESDLDIDTHGTITSVSSDELTTAGANHDCSADPEVCIDMKILGNSHFQVRNNRDSYGNGRVYTVTFTVSDSEGNQSAEHSCQYGVRLWSTQVPVADAAACTITPGDDPAICIP